MLLTAPPAFMPAPAPTPRLSTGILAEVDRSGFDFTVRAGNPVGTRGGHDTLTAAIDEARAESSAHRDALMAVSHIEDRYYVQNTMKYHNWVDFSSASPGNYHDFGKRGEQAIWIVSPKVSALVGADLVVRNPGGDGVVELDA